MHFDLIRKNTINQNSKIIKNLITKPNTMSDTKFSQNLNAVASVIKAIFWPLLIIIILLAYRAELNTLIDSVLIKFKEADKVSIGSLRLEIEKKAKEKGDLEISGKVEKLSTNAIKYLLSQSPNATLDIVFKYDYYWVMPNELALKAIKDLYQKKLIKLKIDPDEISEFKKKYNFTPKHILENPNQFYEEPGEPFGENYSSSQPVKTEDHKKFDPITLVLSEKGATARKIIIEAIEDSLNKK